MLYLRARLWLSRWWSPPDPVTLMNVVIEPIVILQSIIVSTVFNPSYDTTTISGNRHKTREGDTAHAMHRIQQSWSGSYHHQSCCKYGRLCVAECLVELALAVGDTWYRNLWQKIAR